MQHLLDGGTALPGASTLQMLSRMDAWWDRGPCHRTGGQWVSGPWCSCLYGWVWLSPVLLPFAVAFTSAECGCSGNLADAQHHEPACPLNQILGIGVSIPGVASSSLLALVLALISPDMLTSLR